MMYQLEIDKQHLTLEGISYQKEELLSNPNIHSTYPELSLFLHQWFDGKQEIKVHTSGSTGTPKELIVSKRQMMQSARITCEFLQLRKGDKALLCMPLNYIAGKMMVVRSLIAGLNLSIIPSCGHPFAHTTDCFRFVAMVPLQVYNTLSISDEKEHLMQTDILIIGGGAIDSHLEKELKSFPNKVYSTYGMTETLSHIALRKLNGVDASPNYIPFSSVNLSISTDRTLIIDAPLVSNSCLVTNDIVEIHPDGSFVIIGRKDNTINSGGIKIQIEEIEEKLKSVISVPYAITSQPHPKFGEIVVLLIESSSNYSICTDRIAEVLTSYQLPKQIIEVESIPTTQSGKINRSEARRIALSHCNRNNEE